MLKTIFAVIFQCLLFVLVQSQVPGNKKQSFNRPKLVVGIVVDQMRWDFLYRYYDRYDANGGFKKFLQQGFSCENTFIPYTPTVTACGHACIYTGSVPGINGITGNAWWDNHLMKSVYCTEDKAVKTVGSTTILPGENSPKNLLTTTICDELRIATNFRSKVVGISLKDRGSILTVGHAANAAYWYDGVTGNWITSSYYMNDLPQWVKEFNGKKLADKYYEQNWNTLYPINTYKQSSTDVKEYEAKSLGADQKGFPYDLKRFIRKNYGSIYATPYGNTFTADMAKAAIINEQLGVDSVTDFLAISFSSPDAVGHSFGPNSIEIEDTYLRFDKDLGSFFDFLDSKIGKDQYLVFLSADHGVSEIPGYLKENKIPAGFLDIPETTLNAQLKQKFGEGQFVTSTYNYQVHLNHPLIDSLKADEAAIKKFIIKYLQKQEGIAQVFEISKLHETPLNKKVKERLANSYFPQRSGDIQFILHSHWIDGTGSGTTHGLWNPYDAQIPLLWYGWNIKPGKTNREVYMSDIAPTIAALLHIQMPSGCVGNVIEEVIK